jgi:hypothetical protein
MAILLNIGRIAMLVWVITSGMVQVVVAYTLGYLLDRALGRVRRRKADLVAADSSTNGP